MTSTNQISGLSRSASDLFKVAVMLAGFDRVQLMVEIHRRAPNRATSGTVLAAMQKLSEHP